MIELEKQFVSGAGGLSTAPRLYTQVKRTAKVAMYHRTIESNGKHEGYEVFMVDVIPKGKVSEFPDAVNKAGKTIEGVKKISEDDEEHYPSCGQFGIIAWFVITPERADQLFDELNAEVEAKLNPAPEKLILVPDTEFTIGEFAKTNAIDYPHAFLFIKEAVANNSVKFVREERRAARGKPSKIYVKA